MSTHASPTNLLYTSCIYMDNKWSQGISQCHPLGVARTPLSPCRAIESHRPAIASSGFRGGSPTHATYFPYQCHYCCRRDTYDSAPQHPMDADGHSYLFRYALCHRAHCHRTASGILETVRQQKKENFGMLIHRGLRVGHTASLSAK